MLLNDGWGNMIFFSRDGKPSNSEAHAVAVNNVLGSVIELAHTGAARDIRRCRFYIKNVQGGGTNLRRLTGLWHVDCWRVTRKIASDPV